MVMSYIRQKHGVPTAGVVLQPTFLVWRMEPEMAISEGGFAVEITYGEHGFYHKTINALDRNRSVRLVMNGWRGACVLAAETAYESYQDQKITGLKKAVLFLQFCIAGLLAPGYWGLSACGREAGGRVIRETLNKGLAVISFNFE
jgi:hypothetical protein